MTANQISYWRHLEDKRHNVAGEQETQRHNVVGEQETQRHNVQQEGIGWKQAAASMKSAAAAQTSASAALLNARTNAALMPYQSALLEQQAITQKHTQNNLYQQERLNHAKASREYAELEHFNDARPYLLSEQISKATQAHITAQTLPLQQSVNIVSTFLSGVGSIASPLGKIIASTK